MESSDTVVPCRRNTLYQVSLYTLVHISMLIHFPLSPRSSPACAYLSHVDKLNFRYFLKIYTDSSARGVFPPSHLSIKVKIFSRSFSVYV